MNGMNKKIVVLLVLCLWIAHTALAAVPSVGNVTNVRFSQRAEAVRVVFDLDKLPVYQIKTENEGKRIFIDFPLTVNQSNLKNLVISDVLVKSVVFSAFDQNTFRVTIDLNRDALYKVNTLENPNRFYIDFIKNYDQKTVQEIAPGLQHVTIMRGNEKGMLTAHILDVDLKAGYRLQPVLANDQILGRESLSAMSERHQAIGAVNASYFAVNGEILGLTKINSAVVSTTYLTRSALGVRADGNAMIGQVDYNGAVILPNGVSLPISGVNCERGENGLVLYNSYYNASTKNNPYGQEYSVRDGKVVGISVADSPLTPGTVVISAHGSSMTKMAAVKVGDAVSIQEDLGAEWNQATQIMGVGPMLVKNNSVYLTTKEEEFGKDVAGGRAPRTAVGITKDQHALLVVVDGRQSHSIGYTLLELALFMQEIGAVDAVNFDGGGSSEMIIQGKITNSPSDGGERRVGNALVILPKLP